MRCVRSPAESAPNTRPTSSKTPPVISISEFTLAQRVSIGPLLPSIGMRWVRSPSFAAEVTSCACSTACESMRLAATCAVTSGAYLTTFTGLPLMSRIGLYEAWIQTSRPPLPSRLYWPESNSPRLSLSQNMRYSRLAA